MAKPEAVKICPSCETRNKAKWDFCVRCGESLHDVDLLKEAPRVGAEAPTAGGGAGALLWGAAILLVVAGAGFSVARSSGRAEIPDPGLFTLPTLARSLPPATDASDRPGSKDVTEGRRLLMQGETAAALERLAQAVADAPGDPAAHQAYAQGLWQAGQREGALAEYEQAAQLAPPRSLLFQADYAKALASLGRTADAIREYERLVADAPDAPGYLKDLGALYRAAGNAQGAVQALRRAADIAGNRPDVVEELAIALDKAGSGDDAVVQYRRLLEMKPESQGARALLADLLFRRKQPDEAVGVVRDGIARDPASAALYRSLGSLLEGSGKPDEAAAAYREYAKLAPNAADAKSLTQRAASLEANRASRDAGP